MNTEKIFRRLEAVNPSFKVDDIITVAVPVAFTNSLMELKIKILSSWYSEKDRSNIYSVLFMDNQTIQIKEFKEDYLMRIVYL